MMATIYVCDRCGSSNTSPNDITKLNVIWGHNGYDQSKHIKADLCNRCMEGLEEFVKPLTDYA